MRKATAIIAPRTAHSRRRLVAKSHPNSKEGRKRSHNHERRTGDNAGAKQLRSRICREHRHGNPRERAGRAHEKHHERHLHERSLPHPPRRLRQQHGFPHWHIAFRRTPEKKARNQGNYRHVSIRNRRGHTRGRDERDADNDAERQGDRSSIRISRHGVALAPLMPEDGRGRPREHRGTVVKRFRRNGIVRKLDAHRAKKHCRGHDHVEARKRRERPSPEKYRHAELDDGGRSQYGEPRELRAWELNANALIHIGNEPQAVTPAPEKTEPARLDGHKTRTGHSPSFRATSR